MSCGSRKKLPNTDWVDLPAASAASTSQHAALVPGRSGRPLKVGQRQPATPSAVVAVPRRALK